jgi:hypothetical protein
MNKLELSEGVRLLKLEKIISRGKLSFIEVGEALEEIRDKKLYRAKYDTFEEYCLKKWGWTSSYGRRLLNANKVAKSVPMGTVSTERQARALAKVEPENRASVIEKAKESGAVTAKSITAAAKTAESTIELDNEGFPVPQQSMQYWKRRDEIQALLNALSEIRGRVTAAQTNKDLLWWEVNFSAVFADIGNAYSGIKRTMPYAVCPKCQGKLPDTCRDCGGRGVVSKLFYDQYADVKAKKMRSAARVYEID